ncbi:MAG TPA: sigma 54-interacting transcriptional regulator [Polyangiaceae bacterium]|nr:sigma 54-interacting transcriptional regulator [Polyangiaceae bacterium]
MNPIRTAWSARAARPGDLRDQLAGAAATDAHVLLLGETGAGKEIGAQV